LGKTRRVFWVCLGLGAALHGSLTQLGGFEAEQKTAKPLTTQFVKRQPRLTKPLELKKRPQPRRRAVQREMVAVKARMSRGQAMRGLRPADALRGLATPRVELARGLGFREWAMEPQAVAEAIHGSMQSEDTVDMSLEMMDIQALDTGRYHALVIQDPDDKRGIRGFCRLSAIFSPQFYLYRPEHNYSFELQAGKGLRKLVLFANDCTDIKVELFGRIALNDKALFKAPWVFFNPTKTFQLGDSQRRNLGEYLLAGGFMFGTGIACYVRPRGEEQAFRCLKLALLESLEEQGVTCSIERLPNSHPVYHCYYDFNGPPGGCDLVYMHADPGQVFVADYVEGIELEGRLLAFLSGKEYGYGWACMGPGGYGFAQSWDPTPSLRFGVNTIILALTQGGSITHRLMDTMQ
jgi:hypothetical protein